VPVLGTIIQVMWRVLRGLVLRCATSIVARRYLGNHPVRKLHLGSSGEGLPSWFNTDLFPERWPVVRLDATRPFPLPDAAFQWVFSEHMIEHLPLAGGRNMVGECFRVLAPGGRVRLATPDLARVTRLHAEAGTPEHRRYLAWSVRHNRLPTDLPSAAVVINSLFHDHGHRFLFDEESLNALLRDAGFIEIHRCLPGESEHAEFRALETHARVIGVEANLFETLVVEARKP
jgi:predicted SAM-dependent methyltransferase